MTDKTTKRNSTLLLLLLLYVQLSFGQENIWKDVEGHKRVELTPYLAKGGNGVAVIVCPGGSYFWHDMQTEGHDVARWLQANGISAFVLKYRTAQFPAYFTHFRLLVRGRRYPDAQDDLRQAIQYIKVRAREYGINPKLIGAMGFSAGGHLVMSSVELFDRSDWPAFIAPIYPVVTMKEPYVHKRSRRALLGDNRTRNKALCDSLSLECHVPNDCPPVFLVNCKDDPIVDYHNSVLLDAALTAKGIPHEYHQFETGGHGFGANEKKGSTECHAWKAAFLQWLAKLHLDTK